MPREKLTSPISIRLHQDVREKVRSLSEETSLLQAQIYDIILQAGCKALDEVKDEAVTLPLPLRFELKR
tara:strand:+ start:324 stop:530 length:207 start_codon:yes stop_codon:yes gene_type:complete